MKRDKSGALIPPSSNILLFTPKETIKSWLKKAALKEQQFPAKIDKTVTASVLKNHSLAFLTEDLSNQRLLSAFIHTHLQTLFTELLSLWKFKLTHYPSERSENVFMELFQMTHFTHIVDLSDDAESKSALLTQPTHHVTDWMNELVTNGVISTRELNKIKLAQHGRLGTAFIVPVIKSDDEKTAFIKKHHAALFKAALTLFCNKPSAWPKDLSFNRLVQWFPLTIRPLMLPS